MTRRNVNILLALFIASLATPVLVNLAGWNVYAIWHGDRNTYYAAAANGVFHSMRSEAFELSFADVIRNTPTPVFPATHTWDAGPFELMAEQRSDSMMWLRFHAEFGAESGSLHDGYVLEFPWLLIPLVVGIITWLICRRGRRRSNEANEAATAVALLLLLVTVTPVSAQTDEFDFEPINYASTEPRDRIASLQAKLEAGEFTFDYDPNLGYLPALLKALDVDPDSQMLVYSKTSFQLKRIAPRTPRAIYYNDDVYIGYVAGGDVLEITAVDPELGGVFYTLDQKRPAQPVASDDAVEAADTDEDQVFRGPKFTRRFGDCLQCHAGAMTQSVPGHMVRSVHTDVDGFPILTAGTHVTTHRSPVAERWGGWYVTGTHGRMTHLGNVAIPEDVAPETYDRAAGQNVTDITDKIVANLYLRPSSDIVALMVLEHQAQMQNLITRAAYQTRIALDQQRDMNRMADRPLDFVTDSTKRRIARHGEALLRYMLFVDETYLKDPIRGTTEFAKRFQQAGPRDTKGRSLRQLDLDRYLFEYPCSFLIYSPQFDAMPVEMKSYIYDRLFEILTNAAPDDERNRDFVMKTEDRRTIYEILLETKTDLPAQWTAANAP